MKKRSKKENFIQGIAAIMISQVLIKILGLLYKLYLTNKDGFGDEGNAIYSSGFQIYALLLTLSSIGIPNAISKLISERTAIGDNKGAHRIFKVCFVTFCLIGLLGTLCLFFGAKFISNNMLEIPEAELTLIALAPSIFFVTAGSVIRGYFNGKGQMKATANSQTLEQVLKSVLTIIIVEAIGIYSNRNTILMAAGATLATTLGTFLSIVYLVKYYKNRRLEIWNEIKSSVNYKPQKIITIIKQILIVSLPISLGALLAAISKNIDAFTVVRGLKNFLTESEAKIQYGILSGKVDTLVAMPLSFNVAFSIALVPYIASAIAKRDYAQVKEKILNTLLITILIGFPCMTAMFMYSENILKLLFPNAADGSIILKISSISIIFTLVSQTLSGALQGIGKVSVPTFALLIRCCCKTYFKYNINTNTTNRNKWSSDCFMHMPYNCMFNFIYKIKKIHEIGS